MSKVSCGDLLYMCCLLDFNGLSLLKRLTNLTIFKVDLLTSFSNAVPVSKVY